MPTQVRPSLANLPRARALRVDVVAQVGAERALCERQAIDAGVALPLTHRCAWARLRSAAGSWFLAARDPDGTCRGGFAVDVRPSRALPGHLLLRAERFGGSMADDVREATLAALVALARRNRRVLRVNVEVFCRDDSRRGHIEETLKRHGMRPATENQRYAKTVAIDLAPDEGSILASFHATARRHIRAVAKHPVAVRPITDVSLAPRLDSLKLETMQRTGGTQARTDWAGPIALSAEHPHLSRIVGMFRTDREGPESLLAFAWGCAHGDHAHYDAAASTRHTDLRVPLAYALVWDLVRWARGTGAGWFDFGGITDGRFGEAGDRLGGISDFKRYFSREVVDVGGEWVLEPSRARAGLARAIGGGASWALRIRSPWSRRPAAIAPPAAGA